MGKQIEEFPRRKNNSLEFYLDFRARTGTTPARLFSAQTKTAIQILKIFRLLESLEQ